MCTKKTHNSTQYSKITGERTPDWHGQLRRVGYENETFAAFDVTEYVEKPLHKVPEAQKVRSQLDAAILLVIHGNISTALQQVVNNNVQAFEAWETVESYSRVTRYKN